MSTPGSINQLLIGAAGAAGAGYEISRSLRFNSSDSAYLSKTFASAGNRQKFTLSWWIKRCNPSSSSKRIFGYSTGTNQFSVMHESTGAFYFYADVTSPTDTVELTSSAKYRDSSAWYHFVMAIDTTQATDSNRVKVWVNGTQITSWATTNWPSQNGQFYWNASGIDLRIGGITSYYIDAYLAEVYSIDGQALDPTSFGEFDANGTWQPKAYTGTYGTNGFHLPFSDNSTAAALGTDTSGNGNTWTVNNISVEATSQLTPYLSGGTIYNDPFNPNWTWAANQQGYTQGSVNSVQVDFPVGKRPVVNSSVVVVYGSYNNAATTVQCTITYTDATTSVGTNVSATNKWLEAETFTVASTKTISQIKIEWISGDATKWPNLGPITVDGVRLVNSGAGNDSLVDTPTNGSQTDTGVGGEVVGNYATWNPLFKGSGTAPALSNGNLDWTKTTTGTSEYGLSWGTVLVASGKWYWEVTSGALANSDAGVGVDRTTNGNQFTAEYTSSSYCYVTTGQVGNNNARSAYGSSYTSGDVVGVALDLDNGRVFFSKNGIWQNSGDPDAGTNPAFTGLTGSFTPNISTMGGLGTWSAVANFGQRPFAYTAPSGFKALCTTNLPDPVVAQPSTVMDVKLYTGNGSTQTISGLGFSPDFVWLKGRSDPDKHGLYDTVRGATKILKSEFTDAEDTRNGVTAFNSDGFDIGNYVESNGTSRTYVAWTWDAGSSTVTNTAGSITSQVRANASAGFSIVTTNGTTTAGTIGHGLGLAPEFIIAKTRDAAVSWIVYHKSTGKDAYLVLNSTNGSASAANLWGTSSPSSSVFGVDGNSGNNYNGSGMVYYCFAPVAGYSAFGSYTGNGSADGPFVYTGFRPRWILIKNSTATGSWLLLDSARDTYNVAGLNLSPDASTAESSNDSRWDFVSNGFKLRNTYSNQNSNGATYIYAAFAENPFQYARAR